MKYIITNLSLLAFCAFTFAQRPDNIRCEYLTNPLGIDAASPRFTWLLDDNRYEAVQNAYRIAVGTDSAAVASGHGNALWSSNASWSNVAQGNALQALVQGNALWNNAARAKASPVRAKAYTRLSPFQGLDVPLLYLHRALPCANAFGALPLRNMSYINFKT